jgi:hypothetical protein
MNLSDYLAPLEGAGLTVSDIEDTDLEARLFQLMGRLEQTLVRLGETQGAPGTRHQTAAVDLAKEMLVDVLEFAANELEPAGIDELTDRACELHEVTKQFERMIGKQSWSGIAGFFGIKAAAVDGTDAAYERLGREFVDLYASFLAVFVRHFHAADKAAEWQSSCEVFLDDFARKW